MLLKSVLEERFLLPERKLLMSTAARAPEAMKEVSVPEQPIWKAINAIYILDLTLPDGSGYDVCRKIKEKGDFPVIILTVMEEEVNVVMGLELGADDYITKPFRVRELLARMKSVLRRYTKETADGVLRYKELCIYTNEGRVEKNGNEIELTAMEYRLLLILMNHKGMILSRNQLLENIWDVEGDFVNDNTLTVYIKRLRGKIETDPAEPEYIQTVRGRGYRIDNER